MISPGWKRPWQESRIVISIRGYLSTWIDATKFLRSLRSLRARRSLSPVGSSASRVTPSARLFPGSEPLKADKDYWEVYLRETDRLAQTLYVANYRRDEVRRYAYDRAGSEFIMSVPGPADTAVGTRVMRGSGAMNLEVITGDVTDQEYMSKRSAPTSPSGAKRVDAANSRSIMKNNPKDCDGLLVQLGRLDRQVPYRALSARILGRTK